LLKVQFQRSFFCNDKAFIITGDHLEYLTIFFNSKFFRFCFKDHFPELLGDTRELRKVFFDTLPVKYPIEEQWFLDMIEQIHNRKEQGQSIEDLEELIESKFCDIYELSSEDRKIIYSTLKGFGY